MNRLIYIVKKIYRILYFIVRFIISFIQANFVVAKVVLFARTKDIHSAFVDVDITGLDLPEAILLSHCITLTPGTISAQLDIKAGVLTVHALQADHPQEVVEHIIRDLENPIKAITR